MLQIIICVGSSCHLKGSYYIINSFQELIKKNKLNDKVELKASFCLGHCTSGGVSIIIGNEMIDEGVTTANMERIFQQYVLKRI